MAKTRCRQAEAGVGSGSPQSDIGSSQRLEEGLPSIWMGLCGDFWVGPTAEKNNKNKKKKNLANIKINYVDHSEIPEKKKENHVAQLNYSFYRGKNNCRLLCELKTKNKIRQQLLWRTKLEKKEKMLVREERL